MKVSEEEIRDIKVVINQVIDFINSYNFDKILQWSNHVIHNASIYQSELSIGVAVLIYSIGKILMREKLQAGKEFKEFLEKIKEGLRNVIEHLEKREIKEATVEIDKLLEMIKSKDEEYKKYVMYVIQKAKIKKADVIYEHGLSLGRVASLLNVTKWELLDYIGKTSYHERIKPVKGVKERLKDIEEVIEE